jgi:hypothetical protein
MADAKTYLYEVYTTALESNQLVLVQIFRDLDTQQVLHAQLSFKNAVGDTWGVPYQLEKK